MSGQYLKIPLESDLIEKVQRLAAQSGKSGQAWIHVELLKLHRSIGILHFLVDSGGNPNVFAPPASAERITFRMEDPGLIAAIKEASFKLKRNRAQILYTLIRVLSQKAFDLDENTSTKEAVPKIA